MSSKGIILLALITPAVFAQSPPASNRDDLDVTMHVIVDPDAKVPDEIVRRIPLPKPAQPAPGDTGTSTTESDKPETAKPGQQVPEDANNKKPKPPSGKPPGKPPDKPPGKPPDKPHGKPPDKPHGKPPSPPGRPSTPGG